MIQAVLPRMVVMKMMRRNIRRAVRVIHFWDLCLEMLMILVILKLITLMRYCEERPPLLSNAGMGANLCTYYQKSSPSDQASTLLCNGSNSLGNFLILEPGDKSPFLGDIKAGCVQ